MNIQQDSRVANALNQAIPQVQSFSGPASFGGISNLNVTNQNGMETIQGNVQTQQQKDAAGARAASLVGGQQNVDNQLIVK